ncbi:MAG: SGNH/GDSL hydrolase family protein [Prosthecobacter sp.]|uniref:SGNH/GDSL hydrolase family protein n=1 Tax=Prosthecobacter sp. TaxID=1965333 RepID=UPI0039022809
MSKNPPHSKKARATTMPVALLLVTAVSLLAAEGLVRLVLPQNLSGTWFVPAGRPYSLNKAGGTARHQSGSRVVHYRFNEHHMRGGAVAEADVKLLCLGDSFAFGWLVEEQDSLVGLLHARAAKEFAPASIEFMNAGTGGWGAAQYLAFFEDHAALPSADVVVAFLNFADVKRSQGSGLFRLSADGEAEPVAAANSGSGWLRAVVHGVPGHEWLLEHSHLVQLTRRACLMTGAADAKPAVASAADDREGVRLVQAVFRRLNRACQERGAALLVIAIGVGGLIEQEAPQEWSPADRLFADQAADFFASIKVPFIDLSGPVTAAAGTDAGRYLIPVDHHLNEAGSALCAQAAWPWLREHLARIIPEKNRPERS